jgi:hypothetical protein
MSGIRGMRNPRVDFGHSWCSISQTRFNTHIRPIHYSRRKVGLPEQFSLFADRLSGPEGLRYAEEFVSPAAEKTLIRHIAACRCSLSSSANAKANAAWRRSDFDTTTRCAGSRRPIPSPSGWNRSSRISKLADAWRNQSCGLRLPNHHPFRHHGAAKRDLYLCLVPKSDQMGAFFRCR